MKIGRKFADAVGRLLLFERGDARLAGVDPPGVFVRRGRDTGGRSRAPATGMPPATKRPLRAGHR
ncbi:MAG: hypothetical protein ACKOWG_02695, partial [Planctomycetia bacterium]